MANEPQEQENNNNLNKRLGTDVNLKSLSFPSNEYNAVIGFFENRGFESIASKAVATTLLSQAKVDRINVFKLIETLKGTTDLQLSGIVAEVLNKDRKKTSFLGFETQGSTNKIEQRNIII